jgi:hypothetical protein
MQRVPYQKGDHGFLKVVLVLIRSPLIKINRKIILSSFANAEHAACIIKLFTAVIYSLECSSLLGA